VLPSLIASVPESAGDTGDIKTPIVPGMVPDCAPVDVLLKWLIAAMVSPGVTLAAGFADVLAAREVVEITRATRDSETIRKRRVLFPALSGEGRRRASSC
jgi:hypothetical protein